MAPFLFVISILAAAQPSKHPAKFFDNVQNQRPCADGSPVRNRIKQVGKRLYLVRYACKSLKPRRVRLRAPVGDNRLETDFLVYRHLLYEDAAQVDQPVFAFCQLEVKGKVLPNASVKISIMKTNDGQSPFQLSVSQEIGGHELWSAMQATKKGSVYSGQGTQDPKDFIKLTMRTSWRADLKFRFSSGDGKPGERPVASGSFRKLRCYRP